LLHLPLFIFINLLVSLIILQQLLLRQLPLQLLQQLFLILQLLLQQHQQHLWLFWLRHPIS
jgi:hypothetical protein